MKKTLVKGLALAFVGSLVMAGSALALPFNTRPITDGNLAALQTFLDAEDGGINVNSNQHGAAIWSTTASENSQFTLMLEAAGWANTNKFGLYNYGNTGTQFEVFDGSVGVDWHAVVSFNSGGITGDVKVNLFDSSDNFMGTTEYTGVNANSFGFYIDSSAATSGGLFFSEDDQNDAGGAYNLVYAGTGANAGNWWLCFEDWDRTLGSDKDYTDMVIFAESINPIPEPATMLLFGTGLAGLATLRRRKAKK